MDPRSLIGPTLLVFMLIVATLAGLFLIEPAPEESMNPEDLYTMNHEEFKAALTERMDAQMSRQLIYYSIIAVLICIVPMRRVNRLTQGFILAGIGLVGRFLTGDQAGSVTSMTRLCVLGAVLLVILLIAKLYSRTVDNGKRPASERWTPPRRDPMQPDDPETLAKLDRLRVVATLPPPKAS